MPEKLLNKLTPGSEKFMYLHSPLPSFIFNDKLEILSYSKSFLKLISASAKGLPELFLIKPLISGSSYKLLKAVVKKEKAARKQEELMFTFEIKNQSITGVLLFNRIKRKNAALFSASFINLSSPSDKRQSKSAGTLTDDAIAYMLNEDINQKMLNYKLLIENQTDLIIKIDPNGKILFVSPSYCRTYGKKCSEMLGKSHMPLVHADDIEETTRQLEKVFIPPYKSYIEQRSLTVTGWRWFAWAITAVVKNKKVNEIVAVGRDINDKKIAEEKLNEYARKLEKINEGKDKLFSIISHDLRSPFQAILGLIDLLNMGIDAFSKNEIEEMIKNLKTSLYSEYSLIENLLSWSKIQLNQTGVTVSEVNVYEIIDGAFNVHFASIINKKLSVDNKADAGLTINTDSHVLFSVLRNLIGNAVKFSFRGGKISVDASRAGEMITFSVKDYGQGMPADVKENLFNTSTYISKNGTEGEKGTGLGLIICKELIEQCGGSLWFESNENSGSIFYFALPQNMKSS